MLALLSINFDFSAITGSEITIAIVGYCIVFFSLVALYLFFFNLPKLIKFNIRQKLKRQGKDITKSHEISVTGETNAAIAMSLYLFFEELHDTESNIITIKKVSKAYSPWSSKIYGLTAKPRQ
ncbi:MAG: hypothetical protein KAT68_13720 [Bacteroidales bacterium]|nr:hypothetical protein [Bacteroidales bacterium]